MSFAGDQLNVTSRTARWHLWRRTAPGHVCQSKTLEFTRFGFYGFYEQDHLPQKLEKVYYLFPHLTCECSYCFCIELKIFNFAHTKQLIFVTSQVEPTFRRY